MSKLKSAVLYEYLTKVSNRNFLFDPIFDSGSHFYDCCNLY